MAGTHVVTTRKPLQVSRGTGAVAIGEVVTTTWVGDASDGTVPNLTLKLAGQLKRIVTNPGSTAPTDNYDLVVNDVDGLDIAITLLANRDTANTEQVSPLLNTFPPLVDGDHTIVLTNNSVNSATGTIKFYMLY